MNKYVIWAIDPKNKPSAAELRDAFSGSDDRLLRRRKSYGYDSVKIGNLGVIPVKGALYNYDYIRLSAMLAEFNNDPEIDKILLDIDSPGGMISGLIECASIIAKSEKPVYSYIEGMGCSAAYLIASATKKIYISNSSQAGSVGVQASWTNLEGFWAKLGIQKVYFHSKHSDKKNLLPSTKEGAAAQQKLLDEAWDLFAGAIAKHRSITVEDVIEKYGRGEVFFAKEALEHGLVDGIVDDFDACVDTIRPSTSNGWGEGDGMETKQITTMEALVAAYPELVAQLKRDERKAGVDEGVQTERTRAESILTLSAHVADFGVIASGVKEGKTKEAVMTEILDAQTKEKAKAEEEAKAALEAAAKDSEKAVVTQGTLADDGAVEDGDEVTAMIDAMCDNIKEGE